MPANKDGSFRLQPRRLRSKWKLSWPYDENRKIGNHYPSFWDDQDIKKKRKSGSSNIYVHFNFNASTSGGCTENKMPGTDGTHLPNPNQMDRNDEGSKNK
ncbi:hypothetical protein TNCV_201071 [Trichonephila clavipes]|nr:hypothetical protein TNCV_201071 [Trichonephila clavipes]